MGTAVPDTGHLMLHLKVDTSAAIRYTIQSSNSNPWEIAGRYLDDVFNA